MLKTEMQEKVYKHHINEKNRKTFKKLINVENFQP